jgi:CheY-like chemotaxis protein
LDPIVLKETVEETVMLDFKVAINTNVLLVDDDVDQLELRALVMRMSGFTVLTAGSPVEAISFMAQHPVQKVDVAVLDYQMPMMNGCVLADYLRTRYPRLKTILYSAADDIPQSQMSSIDVFLSKLEGIDPLLAQVSELAQVHTTAQDGVAHESSWSSANLSV